VSLKFPKVDVQGMLSQGSDAVSRIEIPAIPTFESGGMMDWFASVQETVKSKAPAIDASAISFPKFDMDGIGDRIKEGLSGLRERLRSVQFQTMVNMPTMEIPQVELPQMEMLKIDLGPIASHPSTTKDLSTMDIYGSAADIEGFFQSK